MNKKLLITLLIMSLSAFILNILFNLNRNDYNIDMSKF
jgi:hypothetical protein